MAGYRVLVIGGYGSFGRRLVTRLSRQAGLHLFIAGRSLAAAQALANELRPGAAAALSAMALDAMADSFPEALERCAPQAVVHTCGPFQGQDYRVAQACIAARAHYIDLADGREFVAGIGALDAAAVRAQVLVTSGASSVPALSSAAVDQLAEGLASLSRIDIGISPGNRTERGLSTVQAILSYCGKPLPAGGTDGERGGAVGGHGGMGGQGRSAGSGGERQQHGWSGAYRHVYPAPVGSRLLSPCDVPDLALLPARYPGQPSLRFGAGLELEFLHHGMNLMAWAARRGWVRDWSVHAAWLKRAADLFIDRGSDAGAMHVAIRGIDAQQRQVVRGWQLIATDGDGPFVPTLAAAALVRRLAAGRLHRVGAMPCIGLLTLADFSREAMGLRIKMSQHAV